MFRFSLCIKATLLLIVFFVGCNLFNPSGKGNLSGDDNLDAIIEYGNDLLRGNEYSEAEKQFAKVLAKDSTKSRAYFGLAKARLRDKDINPLELLGFISVEENQIPFIGESNEVKNRYYQGMLSVKSALDPWVHRDTLTMFWEWQQKTDANPSYAEDSLTEKQRTRLANFNTVYGDDPDGFPLTDRVVTYSRVQVDHTLTIFITTMLGFLDINKDSIIDDRDLNLGISIGADGKVSIDMDKVIEQALTDTAIAGDLNANIEALANGSQDVGTLIRDFGGLLGADTSSGDQEIDDQTSAELEEQVANLGDGVKFYKLGDRVDNDGDGCVDEELYDSLDNDGDGLIDEDLRLADNSNSLVFGLDGIDNNMDGQVDDDDEVYPFGTTGDVRTLGFALNFDDNAEGEPNSTDMDLKLAVASDSTGAIYSLEDRKRLIGGCWKWYTEEQFRAIYQQ